MSPATYPRGQAIGGSDLKLSAWETVRAELRRAPRRWLVSGAAGFIGSHLLQELLELGQTVTGLDNLSTGKRANLEDVEQRVGAQAWARFDFVEGDLRDRDLCLRLCRDAPLVLHQAALGSVPRSIEHPVATFDANVRGFFNLFDAARRGRVPGFVYASSSSVYGTSPVLPRRESELGDALSPYAASKRLNEIMAQSAHACFAQPSVGLRYFNVFGPRQDPEGSYAAVIPLWAEAMLRGLAPCLHGDGSTSRDFCPVACVVQANLLAALAGPGCHGKVFNVALGQSLTLLELHRRMACSLGLSAAASLERGPFRAGDARHSQADLSAIQFALGYAPQQSFDEGLELAMAWYAATAQLPT